MAWGLAVLSHQPSLDIDMHRRKWSLTIQGLKGAADEDEDTTRQVCVNLAKQHLKITDASVFDFSSCHRLANKENSGIIIRFKDFATSITAVDTKNCLKSAKISQPPKKKIIRNLRLWPYVDLKIVNDPVIRPSANAEGVVHSVLGFHPMMRMHGV